MKIIVRSGDLVINKYIVKEYSDIYRTVIPDYKRVNERNYRLIDLDEKMSTNDRFSKWSIVTTVQQKLDTSITQNAQF